MTACARTRALSSAAALPASWKLAAGQALTLRPATDGILRVARGCLWATRDGPHGRTPQEAGDHFLEVGRAMYVRAGERVVIEAWGDAGVTLRASGIAGTSLRGSGTSWGDLRGSGAGTSWGDLGASGAGTSWGDLGAAGSGTSSSDVRASASGAAWGDAGAAWFAWEPVVAARPVVNLGAVVLPLADLRRAAGLALRALVALGRGVLQVGWAVLRGGQRGAGPGRIHGLPG